LILLQFKKSLVPFLLWTEGGCGGQFESKNMRRPVVGFAGSASTSTLKRTRLTHYEHEHKKFDEETEFEIVMRRGNVKNVCFSRVILES